MLQGLQVVQARAFERAQKTDFLQMAATAELLFVPMEHQRGTTERAGPGRRRGTGSRRNRTVLAWAVFSNRSPCHVSRAAAACPPPWQ